MKYTKMENRNYRNSTTTLIIHSPMPMAGEERAYLNQIIRDANLECQTAYQVSFEFEGQTSNQEAQIMLSPLHTEVFVKHLTDDEFLVFDGPIDYCDFSNQLPKELEEETPLKVELVFDLQNWRAGSEILHDLGIMESVQLTERHTLTFHDEDELEGLKEELEENDIKFTTTIL